MALTDENTGNGFFMPVAPAYGGGYGNGGFGGESWWGILLLIALLNGGFGGFGFGGMGAGMLGMGMMDGGFGLYPWLNNSQNINGGFRDQMLNSQISGIQNAITSGFGDVQTALCGVNGAIANAAAQSEISANARQMASMNQMFGLQSQFADCCCENRLANCQTQNVIQSEGNATRFADANNTRDIITNQTANTQAILDKLCQLELDGYKREADSLRAQLSDAKFAASQASQNALISQGFANEVDALYNRLNSCPVPTTPVYGRTPIFTCGGQSGCGCGCGVA